MLLAVLSVMPFMVCLFWCAIFLIEYRQLTHAQRVLLSFMGICTALYFCHALFFLGHGEILVVADTVYSFCNLAVYPVFYLYIRRLTTPNKLQVKSYWVLIPAVVIFLWTAIVYLIGGEDVFYRQYLRTVVGKIIFVVQILMVSYYGTKRLRQFDHSIEQFYSNKENRELRLFGFITIVMLACALMSAVATSLGRKFFTDNPVNLIGPSFIFTAVLFTLAYLGRKQTFDADALEKDMEEPEDIVSYNDYNDAPRFNVSETAVIPDTNESQKSQTIKTSTRTEDSTSELDNNIVADGEDVGEKSDQETTDLAEDSSWLRERLMELIDNDKIYLDTNLKLTDVASRLYVGRSTLSAFINQNMGASFSDFINHKRIDHAKNLIKTQPSLTLIEVSELSGFASPSSFYRAFKKSVGVTPKDWVAKGE